MGLDAPSNPLISIIDTKILTYGKDAVGNRFSSDLYCIAMKDSNCGIDYGRNHYDFNQGVLIFTAPNQIITLTKPQKLNEVEGWMLYFHPDLIRKHPLGKLIDKLSFFNYEVHEALHLSKNEQQTLNQILSLISAEISERIDPYSQHVFASHIELILSYSNRFYDRQFITRSTSHLDVVSKVERLLRDYMNDMILYSESPPTIQYLSDHCNLSPNYLSDLLSKETGRSALDQINDAIIEKSKSILLTTDNSISGVAYSLGFNYPHYFSRLFKQKTGITPNEYRQLN
tara:strand:- start:113 stop:970 length:858 start_codon:yes stop_codon:yes gene_type:complete